MPKVSIIVPVKHFKMPKRISKKAYDIFAFNEVFSCRNYFEGLDI